MSRRHYIIPIFVPHEGCPHNCVFCNQDRITGEQDKVNKFSVENTIKEYLETIDKENSTIEVSFFGGTFTAIDMNKQKELLGVAKKYKDSGDIQYIRLSTRPDYIDNIILDNLKAYGVDIIELGVQSLDKEVLLKSGRGHSLEDVIEASRLIKQYGFILGHQIMLGLPGDNFQKDIETTKKVISMEPEICRIYPSLVIKDTPMETMYKQEIYKPYDLMEAVNISKVVYSMLMVNGINVIRIGLQPTENINLGKDVIAGPFHPAFRELVEGSIYYDILCDTVKKSSKDISITINEKDLSKLYANKKYFFNDIKKQLNTKNIKVISSNQLSRGELIINFDGHCRKISINEFLNKKAKEGNIELP